MNTGGTIDKFIGDSIMALWNAPGDCVDHPAAACRAVWACLDAARRLYASPAWGGREPLHTRFGVHTGRALVGHFGAPMRLSYSAMGDTVNLAARLESLCKQYEVASLVSEAVMSQAREEFVFRLVDIVTVVGKTRAIRVYELLGAVGEEIASLAAARMYEEAFAIYLARDFRVRARAVHAVQRGSAEPRPGRAMRAICEGAAAGGLGRDLPCRPQVRLRAAARVRRVRKNISAWESRRRGDGRAFAGFGLTLVEVARDALLSRPGAIQAMGPSISISVLVGAFLVGCTSTVQVGLANAPLLMNGGTSETRVHDLIANGHDACERSGFPQGEVLKGHTPPCLQKERLAAVPGLARSTPPPTPWISSRHALDMCPSRGPGFTAREKSMSAFSLPSSSRELVCSERW